MGDTIESLTAEYQEWLQRNGLPEYSADEFDLTTLTDEQSDYIIKFMERWEEATEREQALAKRAKQYTKLMTFEEWVEFNNPNRNDPRFADIRFVKEMYASYLERMATYTQEQQDRLAKMIELIDNKDEEADHIAADKLLCEQLIALGYHELVAAWGKVSKYYV